ncbi:MAG: winged helix-turn-helix transcriptional regulator [Candidatus Aenigmarchaeota archaeon]|nr:winged helix-turn-helix transcriptional regulator [Candidatus Aenigmarchaeota archaeon]
MPLGTTHSEKSVLLEYFGEHPMLRVLDFLIENKIFDYSKKQMTEETGLSKVTFLKYFKKLEELGLVSITRKFGKTKLYTLNEENPLTKQFITMELALANYTAKQIVGKIPVEVKRRK